jgi:hypothetical protein
MENVPGTKLKPIDCLYDSVNSTKVPTGLTDAVKISGQAALMADAAKPSLHRYVEDKIGKHHLIPLIAVPDAFTREVFDALTRSFVMKVNHGGSFVEVVGNKAETSFEKLQQLAQQWVVSRFPQHRARAALSRNQAAKFRRKLSAA